MLRSRITIARSVSHPLRFFGLSLLLASGLSACSTSSAIPEKSQAALVADLREYIPSTSAYDDKSLLDIANNICSIGRDDGTRILDNYRSLEAEDYDAFVTVVFGVNGCPDDENN